MDDMPTRRPSPPPAPTVAFPALKLAAATPASGSSLRRVLLCDDEEPLRRSIERILKRAGFEVVPCADGNAAVDALMHGRFDVILADVHMPGTSGVDVLRIARAYDLDVPVLLMTGGPDLGTAMQAVDLGALQYLCKPVAPEELVRAVERAARLNGLARVKREARAEIDADDGDDQRLSAALDRAIETMTVVLQPIVSTHGKRTVAYESFLRTGEPTFADPPSVLAAAERLGRMHDVGRRVRRLAAEAFTSLPEHALLFVDIHPLDLLDAELADADGALGPIAERVVLEISEHASFDGVRDVAARASILRFLGFRFALDDCGAENVGLDGFARLEPEFVKLDAKLVRGVNKSPARRRLVRAFATLSAELGATPIAEAVETIDERDALAEAGYDLMQGYLFGRPAPVTARTKTAPRSRETTRPPRAMSGS